MARIVIAVIVLCGAAQAMKWAQLTNRQLLAGAEIAVDGKISKRTDAPGDGDGASVAWVKVSRVLKGPLREGETITVLFWSRRGKSSLNKFISPRSDTVGDERLFLLKKKHMIEFADIALPAEAADAPWMHAYDEHYDRQIATIREDAATPR
jgi:hypothetical protein